MIQKIYETGQVPKDFTNCIIVPIPKKTTAKTCEQHRTLNIACIKNTYQNCIKNDGTSNREIVN